ncbi:MAG: hypothetical protein ACXWZP_06605 [Gaiellaceae bacterium]
MIEAAAELGAVAKALDVNPEVELVRSVFLDEGLRRAFADAAETLSLIV